MNIERPEWAQKLEDFSASDPLGASIADAVIRRATELGLEAPTVFTAPDAEANVDLIWQRATARVSVFVDDGSMEVSLVPAGPRDSFITDKPMEAAAYLAGVLHGMAPA